MQQHKPITVSNPLAELATRAVSHARSGQWEDAAKANREIIALSPSDIEAHNRLGKALSELGRVKEAIAAFQRAADLQPGNVIAGRNLARLNQIVGTSADVTRVTPAPRAHQVAFMTARGSAVLTELRKSAPARVLATASAGSRVMLETAGTEVRVSNSAGEYLGVVDPRIGRRYVRLVASGCKYEATVATVTGRGLGILIRETYKPASQAHVTSFPPFLSRAGEDADEPRANDEIRPDLLLDRRTLRTDLARELDEEENPRARPEVDARDLLGLGAQLEEATSAAFGDR
jgi:hypothetical protein